MDKLLLSPDFSKRKIDDGTKPPTKSEHETETKTETENENENENETQAIIDPTPTECLNISVSPKTELSEFLSFKSNDENHIPISDYLLTASLSMLSPPHQFETSSPPPPPPPPLHFQTETLSNPAAVLPQTQIVIASAHLHCKLNLKRIATLAQNVEYNPKRVPELFMHLRKPRAFATIFSNGKMMCTGSPSVQLSRQAARRFARIIQKLGYAVKFRSYKIENLIASCDVNFQIRLELLELFIRNDCVYEPELYPALVCRLSRSRGQISIFSSGKMIFSGARKSNHYLKSFREIYPLLKCCAKKSK